MSKEPKGQSFGSLEAAFLASQNSGASAEGVKGESDSNVHELERKKIDKRRHKKPKLDLRDYDVNHLEDHLVEDSELDHLGDFVDDVNRRAEQSGEKPKRIILEKIEAPIVIEDTSEVIDEGLIQSDGDQFQSDVKINNIKDYDPEKFEAERKKEEERLQFETAPLVESEIVPAVKKQQKPTQIIDTEFTEESTSKMNGLEVAENSATETKEDYFRGFNRQTRAGARLRRMVADSKVRREQGGNSEPIISEQGIPKIEKSVSKKKNLKSAVELAMEKTDAVAKEYNEKKLKAEDIARAKTLDDIFSAIEKSDGIQGSKEYFDAEKLKMIIEMVRDGELGYEYITRSGGLRQKVFDILEAKKSKKSKVKEPKAVEKVEKKEEQIVNTPEVAEPLFIPHDADADEITPLSAPETPVAEQEELSLKDRLFAAKQELENQRKAFGDSWKKYESEYKEYSAKKRNPFKKFWMVITSEGDKIDRKREFALAAEERYHQQLNAVWALELERKLEEVFASPSDSLERKQYEKITISDLQNFLKGLKRKLPDNLKNIKNKDTLVDIDAEIKNGVLSETEGDTLRRDIITDKVSVELRKQISEREQGLVDRMFAETL